MQSNIKTGDLRVLAGEALLNKEDYLVMLTHDNGIPEVKLPTDNSDYAVYVILDGATADADYVDIRPIQAGVSCRVILKSTCSPGDILVLADTGTAADKGKVRKLPAASGTYRALGIAEETGVDGQAVLMRPASLGNMTVL